MEGDREALEATHRVVQVPLRLAGELKAPHPARKRPEHSFTLYAGHGLAHAPVNPEPESHMPRRPARHVEPVGVLPAAWVVVGGTEEVITRSSLAIAVPPTSVSLAAVREETRTGVARRRRGGL